MSEPLINPPTASTSTPQPPWTPLVVLKGALVSVSRTTGLPSVVSFQYNPTQLSRNLSPVYYDNKGDRYNATAKQSIDLTLTLDASADGGPLGLGVLPQLASLELMINPSSIDLAAYWTATQTSTVVVLPPLAPLTLFIWGPSRVLPVRIKSFDVKEKEFNTSLYPIFAEVGVKLEVYPYSQAGETEYGFLLANLVILEGMEVLNVMSGVSIGVDPSGL